MAGVTDPDDRKQKMKFLMEYWFSQKSSFCLSLFFNENLIPGVQQYILWNPPSVPDEGPVDIDPEDLTELDPKNVWAITSHNYNHFTLPQQFKQFALTRRYSIYTANQCDPVKLIRALFSYKYHNTLYTFRSAETGRSASYFTVIENDKEKLTDVGAKVIILDGTADISPEYRQDYFRWEKDACKLYIRSIPDLHIKLVKKSFSRKQANEITQQDYATLEKVIRVDSKAEDKEICIFTYKKIVRAFETDFEGEDNPDKKLKRDYLGNLKGRNDFQTHHVFGQIGLQIKPPSHYLSLMIEQNPVLKEQLSAIKYPEATAGIFDELVKSREYWDIVYHDVLADIEQNVFRSPVRRANCKEKVLYYLYFDFESHPMLCRLIKDRFRDTYGAIVSLLDPTSFLKSEKIKNRKSESGQTHAQKIFAYIAAFDDRTVIAKKDICEHIGLTLKQFNKAQENNAALHDYIKDCSPSPKSKEIIKKPIDSIILSK